MNDIRGMFHCAQSKRDREQAVFQRGGAKQEEVDSYLRQIASDIGELIEEKRGPGKEDDGPRGQARGVRGRGEPARGAARAPEAGRQHWRYEKRQAKAQSLLEDAEAQAVQLVENAKKEIERQQQGFVRLQREVATFKSKLQLVYKQHLELIVPSSPSTRRSSWKRR